MASRDRLLRSPQVLGRVLLLGVRRTFGCAPRPLSADLPSSAMPQTALLWVSDLLGDLSGLRARCNRDKRADELGSGRSRNQSSSGRLTTRTATKIGTAVCAAEKVEFAQIDYVSALWPHRRAPRRLFEPAAVADRKVTVHR